MRCALWVPEDKEKRTQAEGASDQAPVTIVSARLRAPCDAQCAAPPVFHPCGSEAWPVRRQFLRQLIFHTKLLSNRRLHLTAQILRSFFPMMG